LVAALLAYPIFLVGPFLPSPILSYPFLAALAAAAPFSHLNYFKIERLHQK